MSAAKFNKKNFAKKLQLLLDADDRKRSDFAKFIGVHPAFVSKYTAGSAKFDMDKIDLLIEYFNRDSEWITRGWLEDDSNVELPTKPRAIKHYDQDESRLIELGHKLGMLNALTILNAALNHGIVRGTNDERAPIMIAEDRTSESGKKKA